MPSESSDQAPIMKALGEVLRGYSEVDTSVKCKVSFVAKCPKTGELAAVSILHDPTEKGTTSAKYKRTRAHTIAAAKSMTPVIMTFGPSGYTVHRIKSKR
jgi:hypothetical protein